jgi:hypothetical protein
MGHEGPGQLEPTRQTGADDEMALEGRELDGES